MNATTTPLPPPPPAFPPPPPTARPPAPLGVTGPRKGPLGASGVLWRLLAAIAVVCGLFWGVLEAVTALAHDERVETATFPAEGLNGLVVDSANGRVRITATETSEVTVRAHISDGLRATGESREIVDDTLTLRTTCPNIGSNFCWVNYEITVPRGLPITVNAEDGLIAVRGSDAPLTLDGDHGSIVLDDVGGVLDVATDHGDVEATGVRSTQVRADTDHGHVELTFVVAPESVRATSNHGRVEVAVPNDGTAYHAELNTDDGGVELNVPTDPASTRTLTLETDHGNVIARTG